jgi:uncharacterized protein (TIGR02996 family)
MTDRLSFLRAILANPADNTPRLVFADWLEEHGTTDADATRVEFVRLWYRLKPGLRSTTKALAAWLTTNWRRLWLSFPADATARAQGRALIVRTGERGVSPVKAYFERGFAERVVFGNGPAYRRLGAAVATAEPLAGLGLESGPPLLGAHPNFYTILRRDDLGSDVFDRLTGFVAQPSADEKRYNWPSGYGPDHPMTAIRNAMTAIARDANGLAPATPPRTPELD